MLRKILLGAVAATGAMVMASSASASVVQINSDHLATGAFTVVLGGTVDGKTFSNLTVFESPDVLNVSIDGGPAHDLLAFCVDIFHLFDPLHTPPTTYTSGLLLNNSDAVVSGDGTALSNVVSGEIGYLASLGNINTDPSQLAAIQGAIWQTEYAGLTITGGSPLIGNFVALASAFGASHPDASFADAIYAVNGKTQGFTPGGVPEPATWTMMIVGFGGLGAMLRRRRQVAATA